MICNFGRFPENAGCHDGLPTVILARYDFYIFSNIKSVRGLSFPKRHFLSFPSTVQLSLWDSELLLRLRDKIVVSSNTSSSEWIVDSLSNSRFSCADVRTSLILCQIDTTSCVLPLHNLMIAKDSLVLERLIGISRLVFLLNIVHKYRNWC